MFQKLIGHGQNIIEVFQRPILYLNLEIHDLVLLFPQI